MHIALFYHSLISDWNNPVAHFLRGIVSELLHRRHEVTVYEQYDNWSRRNLTARHGHEASIEFFRAFPEIARRIVLYDLHSVQLDHVLANADLVIVQDWINPLLIERIGTHRSVHGTYRALLHDTRHCIITDPRSAALRNTANYDGVLAGANFVRDAYITGRYARRAWTWHPAADLRRIEYTTGHQQRGTLGDVLFVSNWHRADGRERVEELNTLLIQPSLRAHRAVKTYGAAYPEPVRDLLAHADIEHGGWLANHNLPRALSRYRATVHLPRRRTVHMLPGVVSPFMVEALACGCPLLCSPWHDADGLFTAGQDYLSCENGQAIKDALDALMTDPDAVNDIAHRGRSAITQRHTCAHRVDELLVIVSELDIQKHHTASRNA